MSKLLPQLSLELAVKYGSQDMWVNLGQFKASELIQYLECGFNRLAVIDRQNILRAT
jgi:hypothetical protein